MTYHVGQRLALRRQFCTVRYVGTVADKPGEWLGVEWDDLQRGKHNGTHGGVTYFTCRSSSPTAASFLRPNQPWDISRPFLHALKEKYASAEDPQQHETIYFSTKQAEEVGFDKFARRQAELRGIHVLVLDHMCIRYREDDSENEAIEEVCKEVTDLDLGSNLFESLAEVYAICSRLPKLKSLTLDGNRLSIPDNALVPSKLSLPNLRTLSLSNTLLRWKEEVALIVANVFPGLQTLVANNNDWKRAEKVKLPQGLKTLDLSGNGFTALADIACVANSHVETLILKNNSIATVTNGSLDIHEVFPSIHELDVRGNNISDWAFFNSLTVSMPGLKHLRTTGNPLYENLKSAEGRPQTTEDGYMLTIARLPGLDTLNYSKITDKERLNAETYYLNQIALEITGTSSEAEAAAVRARHPRWAALCEEYGEPAVKPSATQVDGLDPNSPAASIATITFLSGQKTWTESVPKAANIYSVLGLVGKKLRIMPLKLRLVWETGEHDPVAREDGDAPDWWCSSDDDEDGASGGGDHGEMVAREVELVAGTRTVGTYIEGRDARVRVEVKR
ncbi:hypothetical protein LTR85_003331 [Meristemomyces frigidus]|nr:hypothetical protein LTR85_003331 [Meristemomyces frigidus]